MILFFVKGLLSLGIDKKRIKISIRYYSGQDKNEIVSFWLKLLALSDSNVVGLEKSSYYHKLITSAIQVISSGSSNG